ncbi:MAG: hypothetical protein ACM37Z_03975 [Deltaproteobacteria bacterium]
MHDHKNIWFAGVFGLVFWLSLSSAIAQIALTRQQAKTMVSVHDVKVDEAGFSVELTNSSSHPIATSTYYSSIFGAGMTSFIRPIMRREMCRWSP